MLAVPTLGAAATRAGAGLALAGAVYLAFAALFVTAVPFGPFGAGIVAAGLGLVLAGAGVAHGQGRVGGLAAGGFVLAAAGAVVALVADLGGPDLFKVGHALIALALVQAAWSAVRVAAAGAGQASRAALGALAVASRVGAAGIAVYMVLLVPLGDAAGLALELVALAGFALAARSFGQARRAAPEQG